MSFQMNPELIDQVIFGMENQEYRYYIDQTELRLVAGDDIPGSDSEVDSDRYIPIPNWTSADGFQLMERFVGSLRNPILREELRLALASGRGVFRKFKNVLKERDEIQRLWFKFKDREMRNFVIEWYNQLCELWGCEKIGPEPVETEELILSDFIFTHEWDEFMDIVSGWNQTSLRELFVGQSEELEQFFLSRDGMGIVRDDGNTRVFVALTPERDIAGFLFAKTCSGSPAVMEVRNLVVDPEFRGLHLAKTLISEFIKSLHHTDPDIRQLVFRVAGKGLSFGDCLHKTGFAEIERTYVYPCEEL